MGARTVATAPAILQQAVASAVMQQLFTEELVEGDFEFLEGRCIKLEIEDIDLRWYLSCHRQRLRVRTWGREDAAICGKLDAFILLAGRREDPDSLFFQRRLVIEGDTELGLEMKNLLDTLDTDRLPAPLRWGIETSAYLLS